MKMGRKRLQQISGDNHITKRKRTKSDDEESTPLRPLGTIKKIILKNFMCHSLLELTFEKNINCISGQNGSGKSAILTALVVGLGAEATVTNQGSSIKDFIRTGEKSASVEITLNNRGPDAYQPLVYGGQITIVRNFTAAGRSSCKIKSASGVIISTRARDIHRITAHMNIQIDNPICIMNQDMARTFLTTNDPKQKFILFNRATKLETLYEENRHIWDTKEKLLRIYEEKENVHNDLQIKLTSLAKKMDNHKLIPSLGDKSVVLQTELIWAKVKNEEKLVSEKQKVVEKLRQMCTKISDNCLNRVQKLEEAKQRAGELQQEILQLKEEAEVRNVRQMDTQKCLELLKERLTEKRREKQLICKTIAFKTNDCEVFFSRIEQEKLGNEMKSLKEKAKCVESVLQMKSNVKQKIDEEGDLQNELSDVNNRYSLESVLLIPATEEAVELISEANQMPRHCKQGDTGSTCHQAKFLQVNPSDLLGQYNDKLVLLSEKRETIQNQFNTIRADKNEQQKFEKLKLANNIARRKLNDFKSADGPESTNVNSLETETEIKKDLPRRNVDAEKIERELDEIKAKIVETDERLNNLIQANQAFEERIVPLEQQVVEEINKKKELNIENNFEKKRAADIKKQLKPLESELIQMEKNLNNLTFEANKFGERLLKTREVADVMEELTTLNTTIARIRANTGSLLQIARKYAKTRQTINTTKELIYALYADIKELEYDLEKRSRDYKSAEEFFTNFLNHNFVQMLGVEQFEVEVKIDMKEKTLDLVVIPQQGSNLSDLSGGERSYAAVSFLYALWQCTDFPFYFLDGFDVFMDSVNRAKMMEVLIHHSKEHPEFQFVFLTPQDVSFVHNDAVALTKLGDPKRIEPQ